MCLHVTLVWLASAHTWLPMQVLLLKKLRRQPGLQSASFPERAGVLQAYVVTHTFEDIEVRYSLQQTQAGWQLYPYFKRGE